MPIVEKIQKPSANRRIKIKIAQSKTLGKANNLQEIILAFSLNPQGNHTDSYVREQLKDIAENLTLKSLPLGEASPPAPSSNIPNDTLKMR